MSFTLDNLPYSYDALEPYIDKTTMEIHHSKHHATYVANLNKAIEGSEISEKSIEEILSNISKYSPAIRNNGGGHFNHNLFWKTMKANGGGLPSGELLETIVRDFDSFEKFKELFSNSALTRFGSGWGWLISQNGKLIIASTPNQDNPLMDIAEIKGVPILGLDVWEHAYYLKYQNRRVEYISQFWNVISWNEVSNNFLKTK